jgi:uncharacterized membrane protein
MIMEIEDLQEKESFNRIEKLMREGMSHEQIFNALGATDGLARNIVSTPSYETRDKHKTKNYALVAILIYIAILKTIVVTINVGTLELPVVLMVFGMFIPLAAIFISTQVYRFRGWSYSIASFLCIYVIYNEIDVILSNVGSNANILYLTFLIPVIIGIPLGLKLKQLLCPYLGFWGAKKDENGQYLFLKPANKSL